MHTTHGIKVAFNNVYVARNSANVIERLLVADIAGGDNLLDLAWDLVHLSDISTLTLSLHCSQRAIPAAF